MKLLSHILLTISRDRHSCRGVTLLELLVAMVILTIIVASVYTAFNSSKQSWQVGDTNAQKYQNARGVLDVMGREIACAVVNDWDAGTGQRMDFYGSDNPAPENWRPDSVEDELYFVARIDPASSSTAAADLCEVGYYVTDEDSDGIGDVLRRFHITDDGSGIDYDFGTPWGNGSGHELGLNIITLNFEYLNDSNAWVQDWDSRIGGNEEGILPKAVEIAITVWDDKEVSKTREFKTIVYIPGSEQ